MTVTIPRYHTLLHALLGQKVSFLAILLLPDAHRDEESRYQALLS